MSDDHPALHHTAHPSRDEVRKERRALVLKRVGISLLVVGMLLTTGVAAYAAVLIRDTQTTNKPKIDATAHAAAAAQRAAKAAEKGTKRIEDCTTPGQPCYDDGLKQQADVIGDLNRVIVLAAACADRPGDQSVEEIQGCVIAKLADQAGARP